jgi:cytochrome c1
VGRRRAAIAALAVAVVVLAAATAIAWDGGGDESELAAPRPTALGPAGLDGRGLLAAKGCAVCHFGPGDTEGFEVGPDLRALPAVAGARVAGLSAEAYVRESILDPGAFAAPAWGGGTMPTVAVTEAEADALVAYLLPTTAR